MLLKEVGEFALLKEYIFPMIQEVTQDMVGDDCAFLPIDAKMSDIVITTDAGPRPLVMSLGYTSYYAWGWYTISVNVSDLASAGAKPWTVSLSVDAPSDTTTDQITELFKGINDACKHFNISLSGGNIRASKIFATHCTAIGYLKKGENRITRKYCRPDDILVSIGPNGRFISTYLKGKRIGLENLSIEEQDILIRPDCEIKAMQHMVKHDIICAASDNSDGILGSLKNIADGSGCGFELNFDEIKFPNLVIETAEMNQIDPLNIFLFWGDWQIIATIKKDQFDRFIMVANNNSITYTVLGRATANPELTAVFGGKKKKLNLLRNENFTEVSFNNKISNHVDYLLKTNIFSDEN
jgi:thiamine-monophosphate kinase